MNPRNLQQEEDHGKPENSTRTPTLEDMISHTQLQETMVVLKAQLGNVWKAVYLLPAASIPEGTAK